MALRFFSGFEDGTTSEAITFGNTSILTTSPTPRSGTYCLRINYGGAGAPFICGVIIQLEDNPNEVYFQWAANTQGDTFYDYPIIAWKDSNGQILGGAELENMVYTYWTGSLTSSHFNGTRLGQAGGFGPSWKIYEVHVKIDSSTGRIRAKCEGQLLVDYTGDTQLTGLANIHQVIIGNGCVNNSAYYYAVDDIVLCDTSGSYMNTWPGGLRITRLAPTGAGNYAQWTPSAGNNWDCVDEIPPSDTDYVSSSTAGQKDSYVMADCAANVYDIKALVSRFYGSGEGTIKSLLRIGGADYLGSTINLPSTGKVDDIRYINPATSQPFTAAVVNGLESGMEKE